jgi:ABC-type uncharacterized transport system involved in gliding motility auxiliary subunit
MTTRARKTWGAGALVAIAVIFLAVIVFATFALRGARIDLTASRLYTIAPGTERILGLTEPVNLYFFFRRREQVRAGVARTRSACASCSRNSPSARRASSSCR